MSRVLALRWLRALGLSVVPLFAAALVVVVSPGQSPVARAAAWHALGEGAADPPKLHRPLALASDAAGALYVVDEGYGPDGKDRFVLRFTPSGEFDTAWGRELNVAEIVRPTALAVDPTNGTVLVAESSSKQVLRLTPAGELLAAWPLKAAPSALAVDPSGTVFVGYEWPGSDNLSFQLEARTTGGELMHAWLLGASGGGRSPSRGTVSAQTYYGVGALASGQTGGLYFSDGRQSITGDSTTPTKTPFSALKSFTWDPAAPEAKETTGTLIQFPYAEGAEEVTLVRGIATDAAGLVYLADTRSRRVVSVDPGSKAETVLGDGTANPELFDTPWGISVGPNGRIAVADAGKARVMILE